MQIICNYIKCYFSKYPCKKYCTLKYISGVSQFSLIYPNGKMQVWNGLHSKIYLKKKKTLETEFLPLSEEDYKRMRRKYVNFH